MYKVQLAHGSSCSHYFCVCCSNHHQTPQNMFLRWKIDHQQSTKTKNFCFVSGSVKEPKAEQLLGRSVFHLSSPQALKHWVLCLSQELFTWWQILIALAKSEAHQNIFIIISSTLHGACLVGQANSYQLGWHPRVPDCIIGEYREASCSAPLMCSC